MTKEEKKIETRNERHKASSKLKELVDADCEEITMTAYQKKGDNDWELIEIPYLRKKKR